MSTPTDKLLADILAELQALRAVLVANASKPATTTTSTAASSRASTSANTDDIPQPASPWNVADAQAHEVHFGKNTGVRLDALSERSLSWYATEQPPRLDSAGKPYPPRPAEIDLRNAARTLWHYQKGTLAGATGQAQPPKAASATSKQAEEDEQVPF